MSKPNVNPALICSSDGEPLVTLRDLFAAFAMCGLMSDATVQRGKNDWPEDPNEFASLLAASAYGKADAMIVYRHNVSDEFRYADENGDEVTA